MLLNAVSLWYKAQTSMVDERFRKYIEDQIRKAKAREQEQQETMDIGAPVSQDDRMRKLVANAQARVAKRQREEAQREINEARSREIHEALRRDEQAEEERRKAEEEAEKICECPSLLSFCRL